MLKSKQGKSIETWHVGLCPHATQKDIRHTSRHDWVSTYVPKMVNILPQSQHGTKNSKSTGFPLQQHGVKFATCTSSVVGILSLLVLDTSPWEFYQSIRSVYSLPIILQPSKKQLNSAKTIFATSMFAHVLHPQNKNDRLLFRENFVLRNLGIPIISSSMGKRLWHDSPEPKTVKVTRTRQGRPGRTVVLRRTETKKTKVMQIS